MRTGVHAFKPGRYLPKTKRLHGNATVKGDDDVKFHEVEGVEFYLTPANQIFLYLPKTKRLVWPHLQGVSFVQFDDRTFVPSPKLKAEILRVMVKQYRHREFTASRADDFDADLVEENPPV